MASSSATAPQNSPLPSPAASSCPPNTNASTLERQSPNSTGPPTGANQSEGIDARSASTAIGSTHRNAGVSSSYSPSAVAESSSPYLDEAESSAKQPPRKTVSFSKLPRTASRDDVMAGGDSRRAGDETESSADERTGILSAQQRSRLGRLDYATLDGGGSTTGVDRDNGDVGVKRRRGAKGKKIEQVKNESWWNGLVEKYGSVELENKGSVARDHLALERTFLAWLRTSLSFASIGIAVTQLFRLNVSISGGGKNDPSPPTLNHLRRVGKPLGATFIAISIIILLIGFHRYFESQHYVIRGKFPASRGSIFIVAFMAGALIAASLIVVIVIGGSGL